MGALLSKEVLRVFAALAVVVFCGLLGAEGAWAATTQNFANPGDHPYTVPAGVKSLTVTAVGAAGGNCTPAHGGSGATITATVPVTPGEALVVGVAGPGGACNGTAPGGFGGGGAGGPDSTSGGPGAGGGGASVVAPGTSSPELAQALVVAAGGGGSTVFSGPGINGGDAGSPGSDGSVMGSGGGPGTQSTGGSGGAAGSDAQAGFSGTFGTGGAGGYGEMVSGVSTGGGGGGGGYYGGGGGGGGGELGNSGAGGGGSSYVIAGATNVSGPTLTSGGAEVVITTSETVAPTATISAPPSGDTYAVGQHVATKFSCSEAPGGPGLSSCVDSNGTTRVDSDGEGHLVTSKVGRFTYTVTATSKDGLVARTSITYSVGLAAKIVHASISSTLHTAKFTFKSTAHATGFQCALVKQLKHHKQSKASFSSCRSPKLYKKLKPGKYTFELRTVKAGIHGPPAEKRFTIT
jgi:Glycine rich protein